MSFFKSRVGRSLFRIINLKGYFKFLSSDKTTNSQNIRVTNKMSVKYKIKGSE